MSCRQDQVSKFNLVSQAYTFLEQLLHTLYDPATPSNVQQTTQRTLHAVQASPEGWHVAARILSASVSDVASFVRFYAASTVQVQVETRSGAIITDDREGLKRAVVDWLVESARASYPNGGGADGATTAVPGERVVLRKLSSAVTSLSFRMSSETGARGSRQPADEWNEWLLEVVTRVAGAGAQRRAVLEVLAVVIEQVARADMVGPQR